MWIRNDVWSIGLFAFEESLNENYVEREDFIVFLSYFCFHLTGATFYEEEEEYFETFRKSW